MRPWEVLKCEFAQTPSTFTSCHRLGFPGVPERDVHQARGEPVVWYAPIVMNTWEELDVAFEQYRNGTFIKYRGQG